VTAVAPGLIDTPMLSAYFEREAAARGVEPEEVVLQALEQVPIGRLATPAEVAEVICFLASERASYVSGTTVPILGGEPR